MDVIDSLVEIGFPDGIVWTKPEYAANFRTAVKMGFKLDHFVNGPPREERFREAYTGMRQHERRVLYPLPESLYVFPVSVEKTNQLDVSIGQRSEECIRKAEEIRRKKIRTPETIGYGIFGMGTKSEKIYLLPKLAGMDTLPSVLGSSVSVSKNYLDPAVLSAQGQHVDMLFEDMQVQEAFYSRAAELSIPESLVGYILTGTEVSQDRELMDLAARYREIWEGKKDPTYKKLLARENVTEEDKRKCVESFAIQLRMAADKGVDFTDLAGRNVVVDADFESWLIDVEAVKLGRRLTKLARAARFTTLLSDPLLQKHIEKYLDILRGIYL